MATHTHADNDFALTMPAPESVAKLMSTNLYQYKPLDSTKHEIRLLKIENVEEIAHATPCYNNTQQECLPLEADDLFNFLFSGEHPVRCSIEHVSLDDNLRYVALSYTWGDPKHQVPIIVDNTRVMVTQNLNQALRHILLQDPTRVIEPGPVKLWIDAICINQEDDAEKQWQVQQMYNIYEHAEYTAVWLGLATDESGLLIDQIEKLSDDFAKHCIESSSKLANIGDVKVWTRTLGSLGEILSMSAFSMFIHHPYWRRVWIQQELQASNNYCFFHCGPKRVSRDALLAMSIIIPALQGDLPKGLIGSESPETQLGSLDEQDLDMMFNAVLRHHDRTANGRATITLMQALEEAHVKGFGLLATDPRDHIYALLNLISDADTLQLVPDYTKSYSQLYAEIGQTLITTEGLRILTFCNSTEPTDLPSWAPDWRKPILRPLEMVKDKERRNYHYSASGGHTGQFKFHSNLSGSPTLCLSTWGFDSIWATGQTMHDPNPKSNAFGAKNTCEYASWLHTLFALSKRTFNSAYADLKEALWRTPIADVEPGSDGWIRATQTLEAGYLKLWDMFENSDNEDELVQWGNEGDTSVLLKYVNQLRVFSDGRKYFVTWQGYIGLGPPGMKSSDFVAIVPGMQTPMVLRNLSDGKAQIIGEAYVHGVMDGEVAGRSRFGKAVWEVDIV